MKGENSWPFNHRICELLSYLEEKLADGILDDTDLECLMYTEVQKHGWEVLNTDRRFIRVLKRLDSEITNIYEQGDN